LDPDKTKKGVTIRASNRKNGMRLYFPDDRETNHQIQKKKTITQIKYLSKRRAVLVRQGVKRGTGIKTKQYDDVPYGKKVPKLLEPEERKNHGDKVGKIPSYLRADWVLIKS